MVNNPIVHFQFHSQHRVWVQESYVTVDLTPSFSCATLSTSAFCRYTGYHGHRGTTREWPPTMASVFCSPSTICDRRSSSKNKAKTCKNALRNLCRTCVHFWCYLFNAISLDQTCHNCTNFRHVKPQPLLKGGGPDWSMDIPGRTVQNQTAPVRTSRRGNRRLGFQPGVLGFHPHLTMQMWQPPFIYVRCQVLVSPQIRDV